MRPIRPVRPFESPRAVRLVEKLSARTCSITASRVSGETSGRSLTTRETVATETPARRATSRIVARPGPFPVLVDASLNARSCRNRFRISGDYTPRLGRLVNRSSR